MNSSEYFFPVGSISLSKEQSRKIKAALGKDVVSLPVFQVAPAGSNDYFIPLDVPGLVGITLHHASSPISPPAAGGQLIASLVDEMAQDTAQHRIFAAHTKLMAPRPEENRLEPGKPE